MRKMIGAGLVMLCASAHADGIDSLRVDLAAGSQQLTYCSTAVAGGTYTVWCANSAPATGPDGSPPAGATTVYVIAHAPHYARAAADGACMLVSDTGTRPRHVEISCVGSDTISASGFEFAALLAAD